MNDYWLDCGPFTARRRRFATTMHPRLPMISLRISSTRVNLLLRDLQSGWLRRFDEAK
jgi:hypothetical protein